MVNKKSDNPYQSPTDASAKDNRPRDIMWRVSLGWQLPIATVLFFLVADSISALGVTYVIPLGLSLTALAFLLAGFVMTIYGLCMTNSVRGIEMHVLAGVLVNLFVLLGSVRKR